jgi:hypothetical protein
LPGHTDHEHAVRERRRVVTPPVAARPPESAASVADTAPVRVWDTWIDRFVGSDPGLNRFRTALQTVLTIGLTLAAEALFVHFTHALLPAHYTSPGGRAPPGTTSGWGTRGRTTIPSISRSINRSGSG